MNELDYINCEKKLYNYCIQVSEVGFFNFESSINGSKLLEFDNNIYAYNNYGLFKLISPALKLWQKIHLPIELTDTININFIVLRDYLYFYTDLELWKIKKCDNWIDGWIKVTSKNKDINEVIMVKPLALFNQNIYGITYNAKSFKIVKSPNLEHSEMLWELAAPESFNNIEKNKDVAFMTIVNNRLYAATNTLQGDFNNENSYLLDGIEIWESKTGNIDSWIKINTPGFGVKRNINNKTIYVNQLISSFSIFKSANNTTESLILGTSSVFGAEIWIYNGEGINGWSTLFLANNTCNIISEIKSILFFNNEFYIATRSIINPSCIDSNINYLLFKINNLSFKECEIHYINCKCDTYDPSSCTCNLEKPSGKDYVADSIILFNNIIYYSLSDNNKKFGDIIFAIDWGENCKSIKEKKNACHNDSIGNCSSSQGYSSKAFGDCSHAEGCSTRAFGDCSHAEGSSTKAIGNHSHAEGEQTQATGVNTHAEGILSQSSGNNSHSEGKSTEATGANSHSEGEQTQATGANSHAEGKLTQATNTGCHAEGHSSRATGTISHAEGFDTRAIGNNSHSEGTRTEANAENSHAEGDSTQARGINSHSEGKLTKSTGANSHSEGEQTQAIGNNCHAEGKLTEANNNECHAEGNSSSATGTSSHAEGFHTKSIGNNSHSEGKSTKSTGTNSHSEGEQTQAIGVNSHAEGKLTQATNNECHAEGHSCRATGITAHAEGFDTIARGNTSHSAGTRTEANAENSHAEGLNTKALHEGAFIMGKFGQTKGPYSFCLANGTDNNNLSLAARIDGPTNKMFLNNGTYETSGADYAELFETIHGNSIEPGYFIALENDKIRIANSFDDYILGVSSGSPSVLGNSTELDWKNKFLKDKWERVQFTEKLIPATFDDNNNMITDEYFQLIPMLNPSYDSSKKYIPRSSRKEWVAVALIGQIKVRDDGSCIPGGFCIPNNDGIATKSISKQGYRVLKRTDIDQILIIFR